MDTDRLGDMDSQTGGKLRRCKSDTICRYSEVDFQTIGKPLVRDNGVVSDSEERRMNYEIDFPALIEKSKMIKKSMCVGKKPEEVKQGRVELSMDWGGSNEPWSPRAQRKVGVIENIFDTPLPQRERKGVSKSNSNNDNKFLFPRLEKNERGKVIDGRYVAVSRYVVMDKMENVSTAKGATIEVGTYVGSSDNVNVNFQVEITDEEEKVIEESLGKMIWIRRPYEVPINRLYSAVAELIGACNIMAVNACGEDRLELMVASLAFAEYLIKKGVTVEHQWLQVYRIEDKPVRVLLKNVPPFIPNSVIYKVLSRYGKCKEKEISTETIGTFQNDFKHILSCRRIAWLKVDEKKPLPETIVIRLGEKTFNIGVVSAHTECSFCGKSGHAHGLCPKIREDIRKKRNEKKKREELKKVQLVRDEDDGGVSQKNPQVWKEANHRWMTIRGGKVVASDDDGYRVNHSLIINKNAVTTANTFKILDDEAAESCCEDGGEKVRGFGYNPPVLRKPKRVDKTQTKDEGRLKANLFEGIPISVSPDGITNVDSQSFSQIQSQESRGISTSQMGREERVSATYFKVINASGSPVDAIKLITEEEFNRFTSAMTNEELKVMETWPDEAYKVIVDQLHPGVRIPEVPGSKKKEVEVFEEMQCETVTNIRKRNRKAEDNFSSDENSERDRVNKKKSDGRGSVKKKILRKSKGSVSSCGKVEDQQDLINTDQLVAVAAVDSEGEEFISSDEFTAG